MNLKHVFTTDGSSTFFSEVFNQHYHSQYGAIQESTHIFINAGLCADIISNLETISILEIGFGTGLNALLTYFKAKELQKKIYYETLDIHPITPQEAAQLNYPLLLHYPNVQELFTTLHYTPWNIEQVISENFTLHKRQTSAVNAGYLPNTFHLVYFDAFSPESQSEMWGDDVFEPIYNCMKEDSVLVTYCSKSSVRKTLSALGFQIEKLPGPAGKREILRVIK
jgi:tRNA U34 5-methylaminomethyl-2-thiouridine-forming methyltransferase MnmC